MPRPTRDRADRTPLSPVAGAGDAGAVLAGCKVRLDSLFTNARNCAIACAPQNEAVHADRSRAGPACTLAWFAVKERKNKDKIPPLREARSECACGPALESAASRNFAIVLDLQSALRSFNASITRDEDMHRFCGSPPSSFLIRGVGGESATVQVRNLKRSSPGSAASARGLRLPDVAYCPTLFAEFGKKPCKLR
jgi:hypothetical protein